MGRKCLFAFVFKLISGTALPKDFTPRALPMKKGEMELLFILFMGFFDEFKDHMPFLQTVSHKHDTLGAGASVMFLRAAMATAQISVNTDHFYINRHKIQMRTTANHLNTEKKREGFLSQREANK